MTPSLAVVHVGTAEWSRFPIVLPLFLLWIPVTLLAPVVLLVALVMSAFGRMHVWRGLRAFWDVTCGLPGTDVDVLADGHRVRVRIV